MSENETTENEQEEHFIVETIVDKRTRNNKIEYFVKWKDYSDEDNTWEIKDNLECLELIEEYEKKLKLKKSHEMKHKFNSDANDKNTVISPPKKKMKPEEKIDESFKKNNDDCDKKSPNLMDKDKASTLRNIAKKEPELIIGATEQNGELMFLVKWKDCDDAGLISAKEANKICPQIVIGFYEKRLRYTTPP